MGHQPRSSASLLRLRFRLFLRLCYPNFLPRGPPARRPVALIAMTFVISIIATGVYLVVPLTLIPQLRSNPWQTSFWLALFFWSILCTLVSYLLTALAHPGKVPDSWRPVTWQHEDPNQPGIPAPPQAPSDPSLPSHVSPLPSAKNMYPVPPPVVHAAGTAMLRPDGRHRFCVHCKVFKPDRTHHCSVCRECVLTMDHHCPFTGNSCIGFLNRKFFILFLYYATLSCLMVAILTPRTILSRLIDLEERPSTPAIVGVMMLLMGYVLCTLHAVALAPFSAFHTYLILKNRTTIENHEDRPAMHSEVLRRVDRGWMGNWKHVFGPRPWLWFIPVTFGRDLNITEKVARQPENMV
eukprot:GFKZ01001607.1.p1 GENE.GFKZ01001607.1~~GFKZ01001607.1.p1  ORF type:complete len:352 (+),score=0.92 GFKZ01001607.1:384-1439(+)